MAKNSDHDVWCPKNGCRCGKCECGRFEECPVEDENA